VAKLPKGLYQRGSIFWTKVYQHGRPIYQSTGTSNLTEASGLGREEGVEQLVHVLETRGPQGIRRQLLDRGSCARCRGPLGQDGQVGSRTREHHDQALGASQAVP
jgi:hypothetical protein